MNTKALITTLAVLGSTSSLAMAHPAQEPSISASARVSWNTSAPAPVYPARVYPARVYPAPIPAPIARDHRAHYAPPARVVARPIALRYGQDRDWTGDDRWGYQQQPRETLLADGLTYNPGEYRKDIVLQGRGRFNTLAVNEDGGCTFIAEVRIEFMGGAVQSIPVDQFLRDHQSMTFDLDGTNRAINRIFVYRADDGHPDVRSPSEGQFTVTAM
jgi:hypothetical protein